MKKIFFILLGSFLITFTTRLSAQNKMCVVSTEDILAAMPELRKADSILQVYFDQLSKQYKDYETDLEAAISKFMADTASMTPAVKEAKRLELQNRINEKGTLRLKYDSLYKVKDEELAKPVQSKMEKAVLDVAKEKGYELVFHRNQMAMFMPSVDITALVMKKLGIKPN